MRELVTLNITMLSVIAALALLTTPTFASAETESTLSDQALDQAGVTQDVSDIVFGTSHRFFSPTLNEDRTLNVLLPNGYNEPNNVKSYPVIYLLDGSLGEDYEHTAGLVKFMSMYQLMPESILVGIGNVDRMRDFTNTPENEEYIDDIPTAGGSHKFIGFLRDEAKTFVAANFRATDKSTIIGQSLGGLVAAEILFKAPDTFDNYVIVSPSLWYDDERMVLNAGQLLVENNPTEKAIFLAIGDEGDVMQSGMDKLRAALDGYGAKIGTTTYTPMMEETHATILHRAIYRALESFYGEEYSGL